MSLVLDSARQRVDWVRPARFPRSLETVAVYIGNSDVSGMAIEVAETRVVGDRFPERSDLLSAHTSRVNRRATPVVLVVVLDSKVLLFGPNTSASVVGPLDIDYAKRILQAALDEPSMVAARTRLSGLFEALNSTNIPGIRNSGLFASHELRYGVPQRTDWQDACGNSTSLLGLKGQELIESLGFRIGRVGGHSLLLTGTGATPRAVAVLLEEHEAFDADSTRFAVSPVAHGLRVAENQNVPWLIVVRASQIRLYSPRKEFGVGRKGLAETFFEVDLPILTPSHAGYIELILSERALGEGGTTYEILKSSAQYAVALGERLRDKVFDEIVPGLSVALAAALEARGIEMDTNGRDLAYQLTLRVFFRMLFQVYAEDRKLLPFGENLKYERNALKTVARDLADNPSEVFDENSTSYWDDLAQVWRIIDKGDTAWGVPPYNGGLFSSDSEFSEHGGILKDIQLANDVMGPVLRALLLDVSEDGVLGPVDFRSLSVREFGAIYEGLLESSLGLAEVDLTLDSEGNWQPARDGAAVVAGRGQVYFHNTSGQRKGTGSYFTPSFVVEHLLDRSLGPALDSHLADIASLLAAGDSSSAADRFFDFKVADLAMGSGHFLTSAIDHIEQKMAAFLAGEGQSIPGVTAELLKLENAAKEALGNNLPEVERSSLLRRQIARRCIYGLDTNPIAVELARVSIWIHTFVRGLPMSSLDHNLVCANSLTGIGGIDEALDVLAPGRNGEMTLFDEPIANALERSRSVLIDVSHLAEANKVESGAALRAARIAMDLAENARLLFDAAVLTRIGKGELVSAIDPDAIAQLASQPEAQGELKPLKPAHMPALFPEVFLREDGGFDVLIGNPPFEKLKVEEDSWWGLRFPGFRSLQKSEQVVRLRQLKAEWPALVLEFEREQEEKALMRLAVSRGQFPGLGSGDIDLYQAFAWRNTTLLRRKGVFGIVMPRGALTGSGTQLWRKSILENGAFENICVTINRANWVFKNVEGRNSHALVVGIPVSENQRVRFAGPFANRDEFEDRRDQLTEIDSREILSWTDTATFFLLPDVRDMEVFYQMRSHPSLGKLTTFFFRPYKELDETNDRMLIDVNRGATTNSIPVLAGKSFHHWSPDFGEPYAFSNESATAHILTKTMKSVSRTGSPFDGKAIQSVEDLPFSHCRIAYRRRARADDSRTMICCLLPPRVQLVTTAPYLIRVRGSERDEAFLIGVLSSIPFDWYVRKVVESDLTYELLNSMPIPEVAQHNDLSRKLIENSGRLAAIDDRYSEWAGGVGVDVGSVRSESEKNNLLAESDAIVAHLYGLKRAQVEHIYQTFHRGWDYSMRLGEVLTFYDELLGRLDD